MRISRFFLFLLLGTACLKAQSTTNTDSVSAPVVKSPRGAMLRSAFVPGWGQWYNNQKLKALIVFGCEMTLVGSAVYYNQLAARSTTEYEREFYADNRSRFLWWLLAAHLINILDAYVDAHLWDFDAGPDLSLKNGVGGEGIAMVSLYWRW